MELATNFDLRDLVTNQGAFSSGATELPCSRCRELEAIYLEAMHKITVLHEQRFKALSEDDLSIETFSPALRFAHEAKERAKSVYFQHLTSHPSHH